MTYAGHMNDGSSVQKHSAGGLYPYIIGYTDKGGYAVLTPVGDWIDCGRHDNAVQLALQFKRTGFGLH